MPYVVWRLLLKVLLVGVIQQCFVVGVHKTEVERIGRNNRVGDETQYFIHGIGPLQLVLQIIKRPRAHHSDALCLL